LLPCRLLRVDLSRCDCIARVKCYLEDAFVFVAGLGKPCGKRQHPK
jgi:hypothetical protein